MIKIGAVAQAIPFDNSSNGFAADNMQSALEEAKAVGASASPIIRTASATALAQTTSNTFTLIPGMSITPPAGKYVVLFNGSIRTTGVNTEAEFGIFLNGTLITNSNRSFRNTANILGLVTLSTNNSANGSSSITFIATNGSQAVDVRFRSLGGGGIQVGERTLNIIRVFEPGDVVDIINGGTGGAVSHTGLSNLTSDDHPQYLKTDGTRILSGNLNLGGNNINNIGQANGVAIENHKSRHAPGGADALPTASAISTSTSNSEGSSSAFARADHTHNTVINADLVSENSEVRTTSVLDVTLPGMTLNLQPGTYMISAETSSLNSGNNINYFSLYLNNIIVSDTLQEIRRASNQTAGQKMQYCSKAKITVTSNSTIEIRWRRSGGTASCFGRYLSYIRIG